MGVGAKNVHFDFRLRVCILMLQGGGKAEGCPGVQLFSSDPMKKIVVLENEFEAKLMETILTERGIPHVIRSYYDSAYDGIFQAQKGWGHIEALEEYADEIKEIQKEVRRGQS